MRTGYIRSGITWGLINNRPKRSFVMIKISLWYTTGMKSLPELFASIRQFLFVTDYKSYENYSELLKPSWAPPSWIFGPVWTVLYAMIIIAFGSVFIRTFFPSSQDVKIPFMVALPFILNIVFNLAFTPIQFGLRNLPLATLDIYLVLITIIWAMVVIFPYMRWVTYMMIPYLIWVSFATVLQTTITVMNY